MASDSGVFRSPQEGRTGGARFRSAGHQRTYTVLVVLVLLVAVGFGARVLSRRYGGEVSVPGIYVRVRPERGGIVEARALPARDHRADGPNISIDVELVPVANRAGLIEEVSKARVAVPCSIEQRVSLRARDAPVERVLEAVA